jgi:glyoxylase-like metal-dependent hydrolase (beta-lactamase superfamily II)
VLIDHDVLWLAGTNCWVLAQGRGERAIIVDAPPDVGGVAALVRRHDLVPVALLLTHGHVDHAGGAGPTQESFEVSTWVHPDDDFLTLAPEEQVRALFGTRVPGDLGVPAKRQPLVDDQVIDLAGFSLRVRHTPGHTPGHVCFEVVDEGVLFSGDQLFAGSIGRTDLPGGSYEQLMESMRDRVLVLDDDVRVLPGHGPETTIGRERRTNPFLVGLGK